MSAHNPPRVYFHHSMKPVSLCSPKHWQQITWERTAPSPVRRAALETSKGLRSISASGKRFWQNPYQTELMLHHLMHSCVVYTHFCFSVEQWMMLYMQKVWDLFCKCPGTLQWLIDSIYFHCSLKSWQECSFFFLRSSRSIMLFFPSFPPWIAIFHICPLNSHIFTGTMVIVNV